MRSSVIIFKPKAKRSYVHDSRDNYLDALRFTPSIMQYGFGMVLNSRFTKQQCAQIRQSRMLFPVSQARNERDIVPRPFPRELTELERSGSFKTLSEALHSIGEREVAAFYELKDAFRKENLSNGNVLWRLKEMTKKYKLSIAEVISVYANYHFWRPEDHWPMKAGDLKKYSVSDLYWLPSFNEEAVINLKY